MASFERYVHPYWQKYYIIKYRKSYESYMYHEQNCMFYSVVSAPCTEQVVNVALSLLETFYVVEAFYLSHDHPMSIRSMHIWLCIQLSNADLGLRPSGYCVSGQSL